MTLDGPGWFVVSIHDVARATVEETLSWVDDLDGRGVPATLLVVPGPWRGAAFDPGSALAGWLRARVAGGDEVAQHGWEHRAPRGGPAWRRAVGHVAARGCAELWALERHEARDRLLAGRDLLRAAGLDPVGVTPPGYLASGAARQAMVDAGFRYATNHRSVHDLRSGRHLVAPALGHRPGGTGERAGRALVERGVVGLARLGRPVRIALHPEDRHRPGLRDATLRAIDGALAAGLVPTTYDRLVA